jgi:hypothetical protein
LVAEEFLRGGGVANGLVFVICLDEVLVDGAGFPKGDARVRVGDGGNTAVGSDISDEGGLCG